MANEIKVMASLELSKGSLVIPRLGSSQLQITQTGSGGGSPGYVSAPTAGADVDVAVFSTLGWCRLQNLDTVNFVEWGPKSGGTFYPIGKLMPGESAVFRLSPGKVLHVKADTAACKMQITILEN